MNNKYKSITQDSIRFPKAIKTFFQVECAAEQTPNPQPLQNGVVEAAEVK